MTDIRSRALTAAGYPRGFKWGVSTSSYQIEGGHDADGRLPSIWDTRCRMQGKIANGDTGDVACDHYHRYPEDIALMKALGLDVYRFSVAWPRILPKGKGRVNEKGLDFYDRLIDGVLEAGIEPWLCLYHWDLPQALDDLGGWPARESAGWFADYAAVCCRRYGDRVKHWATFNEFAVFTLFGYCIDWSAPGVTDREAHLKAIHHANLAHGMGVDVIRDLVPGASIGAVHNRQVVWPEKDTDADRRAAALLDAHWNKAFPDPQLLGHYPDLIAETIAPYVQAGDMAQICRRIDWFGLNHYGPIFARDEPTATWGFHWGAAPDDADKSDIGWPIWPAAFRDELIDLTRTYKLPIYVTENGMGGNDKVDDKGEVNDATRIRYLTLYTDAMKEAIAAGADVRGYYVWSLLDNFEWGTGYQNRFGLVHVDYETLKRTPKASYAWFRDAIAAARKAEAAV
ncbi:GH1 family beta-glucosidase [Caenispirillum bisanense]|uniref:GH1 family beta-glucosidase n=1 Tax=Caenispirillum bisanense TaxID=414052 RepID=UPI0031DC04DF